MRGNKKRCSRIANKSGKFSRKTKLALVATLTLNKQKRVAFAATNNLPSEKQRTTRFDADSFAIGVDSMCSSCMTNSLLHFVSFDKNHKSIQVEGLGGLMVEATKKGTIKWSFDNDAGKSTDFCIEDACFVPSAAFCLMPPQHWAQKTMDEGLRQGDRRKQHATSFHWDAVALIWDQGCSH